MASPFANRSSHDRPGLARRARLGRGSYERQAYDIGRSAYERSQERFRSDGTRGHFERAAVAATDPYTGARIAGQQANIGTQAFLREGRPDFERGLTESIGNVVGGLGRRGGLVQRTVGQAGERFASSAANFGQQQIPQYMNIFARQGETALRGLSLQELLARQDENMFMGTLGTLSDVEQARKNSQRRGFGDIAGSLLTIGSLFL